MPVHRQIAQKQFDLGLSSLQVLTRPHPVEVNVATNPITVTALGAAARLSTLNPQLSTINCSEPHHLPHLTQQLELGVGDDQIRADAVPPLPTM